MTARGRSHHDAKTPDDNRPLTASTALSDEHFDFESDDVTWAHVGTSGSYLDGLRRVSNAAFNVGEHAG